MYIIAVIFAILLLFWASGCSRPITNRSTRTTITTKNEHWRPRYSYDLSPGHKQSYVYIVEVTDAVGRAIKGMAVEIMFLGMDKLGNQLQYGQLLRGYTFYGQTDAGGEVEFILPGWMCLHFKANTSIKARGYKSRKATDLTIADSSRLELSTWSNPQWEAVKGASQDP